MSKKTTLIYTDVLDRFEGLSDAQFGAVMRAVFSYQKTGEAPQIQDQIIKVVFESIKVDLDREAKAYAEKCAKRSEAGKKGNKNRWGAKVDTCHKPSQVVANVANATNSSQTIANIANSKSNSNSDIKSFNKDLNNLATAVAEPFVSQCQKKKPNSTAEIISERLGVVLKPPGRGGATHEWQDFAVRYAEGLKVKIDKIKPSWFKIFRDAEKNGKRRELELGFSYLFDSPTWEKYDNARKIRCIFYIYQHGLEEFKRKGNLK